MPEAVIERAWLSPQSQSVVDFAKAAEEVSGVNWGTRLIATRADGFS
jgi:hypothetical protein